MIGIVFGPIKSKCVLTFIKFHIVGTTELVQGSRSVVSFGEGERMLVAGRNDLFL